METENLGGIDFRKIKNIMNIKLTDMECEAIDKWYASHPSCTHAAYISMLETICEMDMDAEKDKKQKFLENIHGKVFVSQKGFFMTYYVFNGTPSNTRDGLEIVCNTIVFDVVGTKVASCRTGKMIVSIGNCEMFMNMKESTPDEISKMAMRVADNVSEIAKM